MLKRVWAKAPLVRFEKIYENLHQVDQRRPTVVDRSPLKENELVFIGVFTLVPLISKGQQTVHIDR